MIAILSVVLLVALTLSAVSAADDNATDEVIGMENTNESDAISLEQTDCEQTDEGESNQTGNSDAQPDGVLGVSMQNEVVLTLSNESAVLGATITAPDKLSASLIEPEKLTSVKKTVYKKFKGKSKYTWKIKMSTWKKMKKQAKKQYYKMQRIGSITPGYSKAVKVIVKRNGYRYTGIAFAVRNYKGIRCEVRGLPYGERATNWGDY